MDALPIFEQTGLDFSSDHEGIMHACGHDAHMTMVLVAAGILSRLKSRFSGDIKFMFQPAEEIGRGAKAMLESNAFGSPIGDYSVACHVWPSMPAGTLGVKTGVLMAAASSFKIVIKGEGGHGAMPHRCVDPLDTAIQVANALQRVVARKLNPLTPSVVSLGSFHSGSAPNIIPKEAEITGTIRTFDKIVWKEYPQLFNKIIQGVCDSMGASYEFSSTVGVPPLENDRDMAELMIKNHTTGGSQRSNPNTRTNHLGAEDMAHVLEKTKGCYFILGIGFPDCTPLHNSKFNFDESWLMPGVETLVRFALNVLCSSL